MAKITTWAKRPAKRSGSRIGAITVTPRTRLIRAPRAHTTSRQSRSSAGIGRYSRAACQVATPASMARLMAPRWASSATRMTPSIIAWDREPLEVAHTAPWSSMPMPMPATTHMGRLSMRAMTAAASP